eukprot:1154121-Pelagomonas_calceolata.AAC.4
MAWRACKRTWRLGRLLPLLHWWQIFGHALVIVHELIQVHFLKHVISGGTALLVLHEQFSNKLLLLALLKKHVKVAAAHASCCCYGRNATMQSRREIN